MKLQNMSVIFLIIIIPIILLLSYYISLQIDTLNMQVTYDTKLLQAAKEAISSFEINTVEWNEAYSETADSKRRDITASINSFVTSFANATGVGGISKEYILPYIPAIAYTLYDGYYIYSPSETKETIKNSNGVTVFMDEKLVRETKDDTNDTLIKGYKYNKQDAGKVLYQYDNTKGGSANGTYDGEQFTLNPEYAKVAYSHILKPYSYYSARYINADSDITVNYALDNYITIYGKVKGSYVTRAGYLINYSDVTTINENSFQGITVKKDNITAQIDKETLTEKIAYKLSEADSYVVGIYTYIYDSDNTKVYFDGNTPFQVNSSGIRIDLNGLSSVRFKKLSILGDKKNGKCIEVYQALTDSRDRKIQQGHWYSGINKNEEVEEINDLNTIDLQQDVSSINYYTESYAFTKWIENNLGSITVDNMQGDKSEISVRGAIFNVSEDPESQNSVFSEHKREVIKQSVISSLNQAITSYSRNSEKTYRLPVLTETDWDQILSNISIIAFIQNVPIGLKYYNNYAIATSTNNKEYVGPDEIYLSVVDDEYYHLPYCKQIDESKYMIGYKSIDYIAKSYYENEETKYYYKHENISNKSDYYCLVQNSLYKKSNNESKTKAYQTALARERYVARTANIELISEIATKPEEPTQPERDTTPPQIIVNENVDERVVHNQIAITITDNEAGMRYQISENQDPSPSNWSYRDRYFLVRFTPDAAKTYYIHAEDAAGNTSTELLNILEARWKNENKNKYYSTMEDAFTLASSGDKLTLVSSYTDTSKPVANTNITVDIGSHTLTKEGNTIEIGNNGTVTLMGTGTILASNELGFTNNGNLYIRNFSGTIKTDVGATIISNLGGNLVITGGTFERYGDGGGSCIVYTFEGNTSILGGALKSTDGIATIWHVSGVLLITGDSTIVEGVNRSAISVQDGEVNIGSKDSTSSSYPYIHSVNASYALQAGVRYSGGKPTVNIYSGYVHGPNNAIRHDEGTLNIGNPNNKRTVYPKIEAENGYAISRNNYFLSSYNKYGGTLIGGVN